MPRCCGRFASLLPAPRRLHAPAALDASVLAALTRSLCETRAAPQLFALPQREHTEGGGVTKGAHFPLDALSRSLPGVGGVASGRAGDPRGLSGGIKVRGMGPRRLGPLRYVFERGRTWTLALLPLLTLSVGTPHPSVARGAYPGNKRCMGCCRSTSAWCSRVPRGSFWCADTRTHSDGQTDRRTDGHSTPPSSVSLSFAPAPGDLWMPLHAAVRSGIAAHSCTASLTRVLSHLSATASFRSRSWRATGKRRPTRTATAGFPSTGPSQSPQAQTSCPPCS